MNGKPYERRATTAPTVRFSRWLLGLGVALTVVVLGDLAVRGRHRISVPPAWYVHGGDANRGRHAVDIYGCGGCHVIPGHRGAVGRVGPSLADLRSQVYIGGALSNEPENLVAWIKKPQAYHPGTAMPNLGVDDVDARDIAAYLYAR